MCVNITANVKWYKFLVIDIKHVQCHSLGQRFIRTLLKVYIKFVIEIFFPSDVSYPINLNASPFLCTVTSF